MKTLPSVIHPSPAPASPLPAVSGALFGIIVLILAAAWLARRLGLGGIKTDGGAGVKVTASTAVGPRERVVIVEVEESRLVLGVTAQQVTLLHTLPPAPVNPPAAAPADFTTLMKSVIHRTGRS